nr:helix-turn-helix domain-containing protein [Gordonia zhenghanii]
MSDYTDNNAPVTWALPLAEVMVRYDRLDATIVYARPESLAAKASTFTSLLSRGSSALLVDGPFPTSIDSDDVPDGLTVIEVPLPIGFAALNRLLAERTLTQEVHVMRYASHVHQSLAGLLHRGAGMSTLLKEVSSLSDSPAVVFDARCETVAHHGLTRQPLDLILPPLQEHLVDRASHGDNHDTVTTTLQTPNGEWSCTVAPIRLGKYFEGQVVILHPGKNQGVHELAQREVVADQATAIIGSEMLRQRSVEEAEERARGDFVQALVHGGFGTKHEMQTRAEFHDIDLDATFAVFVTRTYGSPTAAADHHVDRSLLRLARYAASLLPHKNVRSYLTVLGDIVVVVRTVLATTPTEIEDEVRRYAVAMADDLAARGHARSAVAYGPAAVGATDIRDSYREARVALGIADRMHITGAVAHQELRSFGVLEQIADTARSRQFTADTLGPVRAGAELHSVLLSYLEHGGNVNATARAMNMHRNTMLSKIERLSRACGCDIRLPENQFSVWLALRLELLDGLGSSLARESRYG